MLLSFDGLILGEDGRHPERGDDFEKHAAGPTDQYQLQSDPMFYCILRNYRSARCRASIPRSAINSGIERI
jgi:hypothetical protein